MTPKSYLATCAMLLLLAHANLSSGKNTPDDPAPDDPAMTVIRVLEKLERFSNTINATNPDQLHNFIRSNIISRFAIKEMSQWISGPYSKYMSMTEKNEFQQQLEKSFLNIIADNIDSFKTIKSRVKLSPTRYKTDDNAIVGTWIKLYNNMPVKLDLHMQRIRSSWKIIDIKVNGASALIYYRRHFTPQLRMHAQKQASR